MRCQAPSNNRLSIATSGFELRKRIPARLNGPPSARVLIFVQQHTASQADLIELLSWRAGEDEDENFCIVIKID